eukprot:scaffold269996_cov35-Tisochrysis_lutea.AAC.2
MMRCGANGQHRDVLSLPSLKDKLGAFRPTNPIMAQLLRPSSVLCCCPGAQETSSLCVVHHDHIFDR